MRLRLPKRTADEAADDFIEFAKRRAKEEWKELKAELKASDKLGHKTVFETDKICMLHFYYLTLAMGATLALEKFRGIKGELFQGQVYAKVCEDENAAIDGSKAYLFYYHFYKDSLEENTEPIFAVYWEFLHKISKNYIDDYQNKLVAIGKHEIAISAAFWQDFESKYRLAS